MVRRLKKNLKSYRIFLLIIALPISQLIQSATALCEVNPEISGKIPTDQISEPSSKYSVSMQKFFTNVVQYFGTRYRSGGQTPAGFDCSGFVRFMFDKAFNMELPRSSREMAGIGNKVNKNDLRPGDLVFFQTKGQRINHVGIFIGNDTFVHSSLSKGITEDQLKQKYFQKRFAGAVRLIEPSSEKIPSIPVKLNGENKDTEHS
ncbi:MAG: C40 family peptidase [Chlorobiaceae bacterium]